MKIIVLGAGAIGSVFGALLSKNNDVLLVGRKAHVNSINKSGLKITGNINEVFKLKAAEKTGRIEKDTLIILAAKIHDAENAVNKIKHLLKEDTIILCMQNGIDIHEKIKKMAKCEVIRGIARFNAVFLKHGEIAFNGKCSNILEKSKSSGKIFKLFDEAGLAPVITDELKTELWKKLLINAVTNPLTALLMCNNNALQNKLSSVRKGIIEEFINIAKAENISINYDPYALVNEVISSHGGLSSMAQDIKKGNKTEINYLNGAIVELGKKHNIPTPVNETIVEIITALEGKNG